MSTKQKQKRISRFQIRFETPEQKAAYIKLISGINKVTNDGTKIGGSQLIQ